MKRAKLSTRRRHLARALETVAVRAASSTMGTEEMVAELEKLSATYRDGLAAERKIRFRTAAEMAKETPDQVTWLAYPWVAAGAITLAIGKVKAAGKNSVRPSPWTNQRS